MRKVILVTPGKSLGKNHHLNIFYSILEKHDFKVVPFSISAVLQYRKRAIWHIHWIDVFHSGTIHSRGINRNILLISVFRFLSFLAILLVVLVSDVKIIWSVHNVSSHAKGFSFIETAVSLLLIRFACRVTAFNEYIANSLRIKYCCPAPLVLRQGLYENCFPNIPPRKESRDYFSIPEGKFVLLLFGSLQQYKGVDLLLEAFRGYEDNDIILMVAGKISADVSFGQKIRELANGDNRVVLHDQFIPEDEIPYYFMAADYTIYPYRQISNSGVLFLSLTFATPVIISDKGGVSEVIDFVPEAGILMDEPTSVNIINAIVEAKERSTDPTKLSKIHELLSWQHIEPEIVDLFTIP